jgi:hypothetical protein
MNKKLKKKKSNAILRKKIKETSKGDRIQGKLLLFKS